MVVLILENVPISLRGELSRWMLEPHSGVFVGNLSAMVRDKLWQKVVNGIKDGGCIMIYSSQNEQGFSIQMWGNTKRYVVNYDGLELIKIPHKDKTEK